MPGIRGQARREIDMSYMRYKTPTFAKFSIMGRLGSTPEVKTMVRNGAPRKFMTISLAVDNSHKDSQGNWVRESSWMRFNISQDAFIRDFENGPTWAPGDLIAVQGNIVAKEKTGPDGKRVTSHYFNPYEIYNTSEAYRKKLEKAVQPKKDYAPQKQAQYGMSPDELDDLDLSGDGFDLGGPKDKPIPF